MYPYFGIPYRACDSTFLLLLCSVNWYIKHPGTKLRPDFYIPPFRDTFWLAIISSVLIGSILVVIIRRLAPKQEKRHITDDIFIGLEYLCNQCGNDEIKNSSLRIASLFLRLIFVIAMASFGAVVTSYLAVKTPEVSFVDLQSFLQNGKYKIVADNEYVHELMVSTISYHSFFLMYVAHKITDIYLIKRKYTTQSTQKFLIKRMCR